MPNTARLASSTPPRRLGDRRPPGRAAAPATSASRPARRRARLVARGHDDPRADDHRPPAQRRVVALRDRGVEGVDVSVEDQDRPHANGMFGVRSRREAVRPAPVLGASSARSVRAQARAARPALPGRAAPDRTDPGPGPRAPRRSAEVSGVPREATSTRAPTIPPAHRARHRQHVPTWPTKYAASATTAAAWRRAPNAVRHRPHQRRHVEQPAHATAPSEPPGRGRAAARTACAATPSPRIATPRTSAARHAAAAPRAGRRARRRGRPAPAIPGRRPARRRARARSNAAGPSVGGHRRRTAQQPAAQADAGEHEGSHVDRVEQHEERESACVAARSGRPCPCAAQRPQPSAPSPPDAARPRAGASRPRPPSETPPAARRAADAPPAPRGRPTCRKQRDVSRRTTAARTRPPRRPIAGRRRPRADRAVGEAWRARADGEAAGAARAPGSAARQPPARAAGGRSRRRLRSCADSLYLTPA